MNATLNRFCEFEHEVKERLTGLGVRPFSITPAELHAAFQEGFNAEETAENFASFVKQEYGKLIEV